MGLRAQYHLHKHFSRLKAIIKYLKGKLNKNYFFFKAQKYTTHPPSPDPRAASFTVGFISFLPYGEVATAISSIHIKFYVIYVFSQTFQIIYLNHVHI